MKKLVGVLLIIIAVYYLTIPSPFALEVEINVVPGEVKDAKQLLISQIPVLMYHSISDAGGPWAELSVSPSSFSEQMKYLTKVGYQTVTLKDVYLHWTEKAPLPAKPIVLTFDDGYLDNYTNAFPIMQQEGHVGVMFPYLNKVGTANSLTWEHLVEFSRAGWEIGNHSKTHMDLTLASQSQLDREITFANEAFEENVGIDIISFCYPAGRYNQEIIDFLIESPIVLAVTTNYGVATSEEDLYELSRVRINRSDYLNGFIRKLQRYEN
jgi:peptidoglycan/xylan/chitin deacetylase (PgdA/CDA1 family)